ncbi:RDD family protein [Actinomadura parmotrematis]|uniref:RDD family protein n=1 Tax=Actinomadura parmotrematis TaxID=2864039 RepID=A0ABS7FZZ9_9ACTN|nr:RDD family protein [Actinomadura parmotrematis]MBW8484988.1 RDD family protein [Actinomadura parmotrematis]
MSETPHRGGPYSAGQGSGSYGPPPPYREPDPRRRRAEQPPSRPQPPARQEQWPQEQRSEPRQPKTRQFNPGDYDAGGYDAGGYDADGYTEDLSGYAQGGDTSEQGRRGYGGGEAAEPQELPTAPIGRRVLARIIDNGLAAVIGFALILPITLGIYGLDTSGSKATDEGGIWNWPIIFMLFAVMAVLPFAAEAAQLAMSGRTLGKRFLHIAVVADDPQGAPLTTARAVGRAAINNVGYQIAFFVFLTLSVKVWSFAFYGAALAYAGVLMSYLWAVWDEPLRQSLHDRLAGTYVVDERGYGDGGYEG